MVMPTSFHSRLSRPPIVVAPGVYDAFTALIAAQAGFDTLYLTGAGIAYTRLGRPDIGLVSLSEVVGRLVQALGREVPLMANMVEGGKTPVLPAAELQQLGFALVIFPGGIVRALAHTAREFYASLATHGTTEPFRSRMLDFAAIN